MEERAIAERSAPIMLPVPHLVGAAASEVWTRTPPWPPSPGFASPLSAELSVRNVSQPTLQPFIPDLATGAAMIVVPGGGFLTLTIEREGYWLADWLRRRGVAAFVLKHRVVETPTDSQQAAVKIEAIIQQNIQRIHAGASTLTDILSLEQREAMWAARDDALEAVRYLRAHACEWELLPNRIGILGFSSGAVTAINVVLEADSTGRPDLIGSMYGNLPSDTAIPSMAPPAFVAAAADDALVPSSIAIYNAWRAAGARAELHILEDGGHGFGMLRQGKSTDHWPELLHRWLTAHGFGAKDGPG